MKKGQVITQGMLYAMILVVTFIIFFGWYTTLEKQIQDLNEIEATFNAEKLALAINTLGSTEEDTTIKSLLPARECELKFDNYEMTFKIDEGSTKLYILNKIDNSPLTINCDPDDEKEIIIEKIGSVIKVI